MDSTADTFHYSDSTSYTLRSGVKALVSTGERVLLVKERHQDGDVFWTLPGGGVEQDETKSAALRRELREELGCHISVHDPIDSIVYAHRSCHETVTRYTVFDCTLRTTIRRNPCHGIHDVRWVRPENLPATTLPQVRLVVRRQSER